MTDPLEKAGERVEKLKLEVEIAPHNRRGLRLANPVMTASGTFGYGVEFADFLDVDRLGGIVCKGTTVEPRQGNPQIRVAETPSGMLNSIGLQNVGVQALIREKAPLWATWKTRVVVNISGHRVEEYPEMARLLDGVPGVSGLELNVSCPNIAEGGMEFGRSPRLAAAVTHAVRAATGLPIMVKLTPNVTDIVEVAKAVEDAGADCISLVNTFVGMAIDVRTRRPVLGAVFGGLSGPAIKPLALAMVYQVSRAVRAPVVGIGGIVKGEDAIEFIMAGARAVQVGTANFVNPRASIEVLEGVERWMGDNGVRDINALVGAAWG
ncbi:MAG: dihydroorotate dehydrogenase [Chloroflexi bacterium]|nr:dihydroorotate dehydrogenase [Chloroflexota bacterium]